MFSVIFGVPGNLPEGLGGAQTLKIAKMKHFLKGNIYRAEQGFKSWNLGSRGCLRQNLRKISKILVIFAKKYVFYDEKQLIYADFQRFFS